MRKVTAGLFISLDGVIDTDSDSAGDLIEFVTALKRERGGDIAMSGSPSIVRQLLTAGLVDEHHLFVHPVAVCKGLSSTSLRSLLFALDNEKLNNAVRPSGSVFLVGRLHV